MKTNIMLERQHAANLLAWQGAMRVSGLLGISAISAVRKSLDTYLLWLRHSADYVKNARLSDPPEKAVSSYADAVNECVEKSWQDYRNNVQILLLTQDEARIWASKVDRALTGA
ncbi:MAG TPA: hypothetical protein PLP22_02485 [Candidatus Competibacter sp.]|jgi:hypothetical protein|nr:hypothetical protein [Candidatus Competibacteraceae bacterium]HAO32107.1 hypothetical protein [Candidatus Competibacteraceae bacterium]HRE53646.1 hypothetical protein [Candidatus Competibacter sp.]HUM95076.1 hypothetical protein [Candidatus Competibacter sp.]